MGLLEKRRFRNFLQWVNEYDPNEPKTFKGVFDTSTALFLPPFLPPHSDLIPLTHPCMSTGIDPKSPMRAAFDKFGLDQNTVDFTGHALALYRDDE